MKKRVVQIIVTISLLVWLGSCAYQQVVLPTLRFSTAEEAFKRSAPWGAKLRCILEDQGVAVVLYEENSVTIISSMTGKDKGGWLPLLGNVSYRRHVSQNDVLVFIYEEYGKYILQISTWYSNQQAMPKIHDTLNSDVKSYVIQAEPRMNLMESLIVSDEPFPGDYRLFCGSKSLTLNAEDTTQ